ncbi:HupE/UreJ family protein [Variovorax sp. ZT4R33]|uniref:HupE/UreJ family protein n=1 Tax=Variovorax sp. ZT4R33 TaxID=3443743 RepID=UPI003F44EBC5
MRSSDVCGSPSWLWRQLRACASVLLCIGLSAAALPASAHKASDAYLQLQTKADNMLAARWDIALRDLDATLDLDVNADRKLSWGEVRTRIDDIQAYALGHLRFQQGRCALAPAEPAAVEDRIDGAYLVLWLQGRCEPAATLEVDYRLFREIDPTHRGLLRVASASGTVAVLSLDPAGGPVSIAWPGEAAATASVNVPTASAAPAAPAASTATAAGHGFFRDGVHHILIGYDHVLFLICLLLPAVLRRRDDRWQPVATWREAVWPMLGLVTMFTIAHSITLALASFKLITVSPRVIEPAIAITIIVAALDNLHPVLRGRRKLFTFLFGLIHGFGFASVLGELELPALGFATALFQFNLGVEAGQLVIVSVALALLLILRGWRGYPSVVLKAGSGLAVMLAALWLVERVWDVQLLPAFRLT